jgi:hypothetical protein
MKKILPSISPRIKEILGQGVLSGMEKGVLEVSTNQVYNVGMGRDIKQRRINAEVNYSLKIGILAAKEPTLSVETVEHSTGHFLRITHGRFIIYPKRVDSINHGYEDEPDYHKELIPNNPTRQGEFFDFSKPDNSVFVQLLFGRSKQGFFASLSIPDSTGGIYEKEELRLQSAESLAPEEAVRVPKKLAIRSEKISGQ